MILSSAIFTDPPGGLEFPSYDRSGTRIGIVHFGPGAFHRGHQAVYTDDVLALDPSWAICAVSLRSRGVRDALAGQDNLYSLALLGSETSYRLIGSIREVLVAAEGPEVVLARLEDEATRILTLTITEKGYCLGPDGGLDFDHADIRHDLSQAQSPRSAIGFIAEGLQRRRARGMAPFVPISCDNLGENGTKLRAAVLQYAECIDRGLAEWIREEVPFPGTMVDAITPATDDALRARLKEDLGIIDAWPVQREPFAQWVIEDAFAGLPRPPWEKAGVILAKDVGPFEEVKLRLLNGSHSALAYLGMLAGVETVAGAMAIPELASYVSRLMRDEICPGLRAPEGMELEAYCRTIEARLSDPSLEYRLSQIAWDGSQKIPVRLLPPIEDNLESERPTRLLSLAVAAWMRFSVRAAREGLHIRDPLSEDILAVAEKATGEAGPDVDLFLAIKGIFPERLVVRPGFREGIVAAYGALGEGGRQSVLEALA